MHQVRPTTGDSSWFVNDRFGLFIHWGIYAMPARHEWVKQREEISTEDYDTKYFPRFDPDLYDPEVWAAEASNAGMKYFCITTKHHDGFCLWDSKLTDYKATNTPAKSDLIRPMVDAFRAHDMKVGFYHSLIDWHHPHFTIDDVHSMRNHADRAKLNASRDQQQYIDYLHGQVRELLTDYGKVDCMFYDFSYPAGARGRPDDFVGKGRKEWRAEELIKLTRQLQPDILVDDRLDLLDTPDGWDYRTPEQFMPRAWPTDDDGTKIVWETCQTFSGSWGYHRDESSWKSVDQLLRMLIEIVSKGGNLLLNVGPTGRGEFDARALDRLRGMGAWMKRHDRSIYGCTAAPEGMITPQDCRLTWNPQTKRMYVHIFAWPYRQLTLDGLAGKVEHAQLLNDGSEVFLQEPTPHQMEMGGADGGAVTLDLPVEQPRVAIPVVELFMK